MNLKKAQRHFMRNLGLVLLILIIFLKLAERFILPPQLSSYVQQYLLDHKDQIKVESVQFEGSSVALSGIKIAGIDDSFSAVGIMEPILLGWPGVKFILHPSDSKFWVIQGVEGKVAVGMNSFSADKIVIQNFGLLKVPDFVIPQTLVSFDYDKSARLVQVSLEIPQFGNSAAAGQIYVAGELNPQDDYSGKLSVRIVNPAAIIEQLARTELLSKQQLSAIKGLTSALSNEKAEVTLPLSLEKKSVYLGPIRLYPKSSRDDNLARMGEGVISNLFRSFVKGAQ